MPITRFLAHQRVIGRSPRTVARRAWSLNHWADHLAAGGHTLTTATVADLEGFLARFPAAQSRYSIRSDIHQLYRHLRRTHPHVVDPTETLDAIHVPRRAASPIHADEVRRLLGEVQPKHLLVQEPVNAISRPTG
jgi:site-specific recombinase XerD